MIGLSLTLSEQQIKLLNARTTREFYRLCPEELLLSRISSSICESQLREVINKYKICDICDFSGLHISASKLLAKCVTAVSYKFPRIRSRINFIGSRKGYLSLLDKFESKDLSVIKDLGLKYIADENLIRELVNPLKSELAKSSKHGGNTLAQAISVMGVLDGIILDEEDFGAQKFHQTKIELERAVAEGQSPQDCASVEAVVYHEIGHILDYLCGVSKMAEAQSYFKSYKSSELTEALSEYAGESLQEFLAEGFSESMVSPSPRPTAKKILSYFEGAYKALKF